MGEVKTSSECAVMFEVLERRELLSATGVEAGAGLEKVDAGVAPAVVCPVEETAKLGSKADQAGVRAVYPTNQTITVLATAQVWSGHVDNTNPADADYVYQFTLTAGAKGKARSLKVRLCEMSDDADIDLLNSAQDTRLAYSEKWYAKDEKISAKLGAGTYYLRIHIGSVYNPGGQYARPVSTNFNLMVQAK